MKVGEVRCWAAPGQAVCEKLFWRELLKVQHGRLVSTGSLHCGLLEALWNRS